MSQKAYDFSGLAGCVTRFKSRVTSTQVSVYHAEQAGLDTSPETPWVVVCDHHGTMLGVGSLAQARRVRDPRSFCEDCRENDRKCTRCGAVYAIKHWRKLSFVGLQDNCGEGWLELRNCPCQGTMALRITDEEAQILRKTG